MRQEIELDGAVNPSCLTEQPAKHLVIGLFQPLKVDQIRLAYIQQQQKKQLEVKWIGEKTCDRANAVKASKSPFSMSTG